MKKIFTIVFLISLVLVFSCNTASQRGDLNKQTKAQEAEIDTMAAKAQATRLAYVQKLKEMNNEQLAQQLEKESDRGLEPFNSLAFAESVRRGQEFAETLAQSIKDNTKTSFLSLLALNKIDVNSYNRVDPRLRTAILLDALKNSKLYNAFGLPHVRIEFAGESIIKEGKNIRKGLMELLSDTKPAPVWGSEDYTEYLNYQYRVCDYALFFLKKIDGDEKFVMPQSPEERDRIIEEMLKGNEK